MLIKLGDPGNIHKVLENTLNTQFDPGCLSITNTANKPLESGIKPFYLILLTTFK